MLQLHDSVHTYNALFDSDKPRLTQHQRYYTNIALKKWCNTLRIHVHDIVKPDLYYEKIAATCDTRHVAATCDSDGRFILFCRKSSAASGKHT